MTLFLVRDLGETGIAFAFVQLRILHKFLEYRNQNCLEVRRSGVRLSVVLASDCKLTALLFFPRQSFITPTWYYIKLVYLFRGISQLHVTGTESCIHADLKARKTRGHDRNFSTIHKLWKGQLLWLPASINLSIGVWIYQRKMCDFTGFLLCELYVRIYFHHFFPPSAFFDNIPKSHNTWLDIRCQEYAFPNDLQQSPKIVRGCSKILVDFPTLPKLPLSLCRLRFRKGAKIVVGRMFRNNSLISERCRKCPSLFADCEINF